MTHDRWMVVYLRDCLQTEFPGEWGNAPDSSGGNATVLRSTDIDDEGHVDLAQGVRRRIAHSKITAKRLVSGDILLETSGGGPGKPVGRVALFRDESPCVYLCSNFFRTLRPDAQRVDPRFLAWRLQLLYTDPSIWIYQQQTTGIINLKRRDYLGCKIMLPPFAEQRWIAEVLDALDEAIRQSEQLIAKLKQMKHGLLHDLLTRGIDDNGELRDPERHPEQFQDSPLGCLPKDWKIFPLERCVKHDAPITYGIVQAGPHIPSGIPYIRTGDMAEDTLIVEGLLRTSPRIAASYARSRVESGDIVCAIRATVGKVLPVPMALDGANLTQGTARIAPRRDLNSQFILWALRSAPVQRQFDLCVKGTTFKEITLAALRRIMIPIPDSREEQDRIATMLQAMADLDKQEVAGLTKLRMIKQGLMEDLLTGRVRVTGLAATP